MSKIMDMFSPKERETTYLVAPNEEIKKLWQKEYPDIKIYVSRKLPITDKKVG